MAMDDDLIELIRRATDPTITDEALAQVLDELSRTLPHPAIADLIFYHDPELSPQEILEAARAYQPIVTPPVKKQRMGATTHPTTATLPISAPVSTRFHHWDRRGSKLKKCACEPIAACLQIAAGLINSKTRGNMPSFLGHIRRPAHFVIKSSIEQ